VQNGGQNTREPTRTKNWRPELTRHLTKEKKPKEEKELNKPKRRGKTEKEENSPKQRPVTEAFPERGRQDVRGGKGCGGRGGIQKSPGQGVKAVVNSRKPKRNGEGDRTIKGGSSELTRDGGKKRDGGVGCNRYCAMGLKIKQVGGGWGEKKEEPGPTAEKRKIKNLHYAPG